MQPLLNLMGTSPTDFIAVIQGNEVTRLRVQVFVPNFRPCSRNSSSIYSHGTASRCTRFAACVSHVACESIMNSSHIPAESSGKKLFRLESHPNVFRVRSVQFELIIFC